MERRILFKMYPDGLVKQAVLQVLPFFCESMQAKKSGSIAFIDSDLQVGSGIEEGELFPFIDVGIGFTDLIDYFVTFKDDLKTPASALVPVC